MKNSGEILWGVLKNIPHNKYTPLKIYNSK